MVQGWLCSHLWEHYQFTQDETFLKNEAYPLMKGAAEFFADWLIDDGNGHLVTPVGVSPENRFITEDGQTAAMSMGPTMDMAIIRETFTRTIAASEMFNLDESFRNELKDKLAKMTTISVNTVAAVQPIGITVGGPAGEAIDGLVALGYAQNEVETIVERLDDATRDVPALIKAALAEIGKGR